MKGGRAESKTCQIRNKKMKKAHMDEMILYEKKKKRKITENKLKIKWFLLTGAGLRWVKWII